ncbi:siderophore-interacting protein [Aestuariimicrobium sp. Y1814]|uniref:siderophore-interacting protein n=1 Tax=Aestuariimicrobium sp. Y1814 TaxID=3418742 RepID=UPI003DA6EEDD
MNRPAKPLARLTVVRREQLHPDLVRVWFSTEGFQVGEFSDSYVKLLFDDHGPVSTPPAEGERPTTRTYSVRTIEDDLLALDFVVHGDEGLAAPWAAAAEPGEVVLARGPGGAWSPRTEADFHLFLGDESALPAIAAGLERLPTDARGLVVIEACEHTLDLRHPDGVEVRWLVRGDEDYRAERLADQVRDLDWAALGDVSIFAHGERGSMRALRPVFTPLGLDKDRLSLSGYWARGRVEDQFQAEKRTEVGRV